MWALGGRVSGRTFIVYVVAAVLVVAGCDGDDSDNESRPSISVDLVLAPASMPGEQWPEDDWEVRITGVIPFTPGDPMMRGWSTQKKVANLVHEVIRFSDVGKARRYFERNDPRSDEDFPLQVDESTSYTSNSADESHLYCLGQEGTSEACGTWVYWGRYGQYVVEIDYLAGIIGNGSDVGTPHDGIALDEFLGYLQPFDEHVTRMLAEDK